MANAIPVHSEPKTARKVDVKPAPAETTDVDPAKEAALSAQAAQLDDMAEKRQARDAAKEAKEVEEGIRPAPYTSTEKEGIAGARENKREPQLVMQLPNHAATRVDH